MLFECVCTFFFFFGYLLEVLVNDGDCQQDTSTRANSPHEVCKDGKCTDAASTESCCSWNIPVQVLDHRVFSLTINHQFLVHQLPSNISWAWSWDVDPNSREESARGQHENGINHSVNWVFLNVIEALRRADVVSQTTNWCLVTSHIIVLPLAEEANNEVSTELSGQDLSEEVDIGNEGGLKNNWNIRGVEKLDRVWLLESSHLSAG